MALIEQRTANNEQIKKIKIQNKKVYNENNSQIQQIPKNLYTHTLLNEKK